MKVLRTDRFVPGQRVVIEWPCEPGCRGKRATILDSRRTRDSEIGSIFAYTLLVDGDPDGMVRVAFQEELRAINETDLVSTESEETRG